MSTLGGNRGERNAKPKFQQLDINSLYRTSRGETSEPTAQKNAVPRKHGMQTLGKVPSARRPPANLPSLKAETSSPANAPILSNDQQQQQTTNSSSASWADSSTTEGPRTLNATASGKQTQLNTSGGSSNQTQSASSSSSTSWSAVATGAGVKEESLSQPPLYQSPQFQNEFPSLDGTVTTNVNATATGQKQQNSNSNSHDSGEQMSLRPSTDVASWMQQQQSSSGNVRGAGGENGQGNYQHQDLNVNAPKKFMALMPSFIQRGVQPAGSNSSSSHPQQTNSSNQMNQNSGNNSGNYQNQARSERGRNSSHYGGSSYNDYSNNRDSGPPRHRQAPPPRHSGRQQHDDRGSSYEPEIVVQRPIIKEEELERIDSLARDEGWSKHDEIDYNKKLQISDDETDDVKPKDMMSNEKKLDAWRDGEKKDMKQQNGPVSRIDSALAERLQKRREEEERNDRERKLAAQKKLYELEEKTKKSSPPIDKEKILDEKLAYPGDYDRKRGSGSVDYGKKYGNDKYDSYDNYGRGAPASDFKKTSYQSNLPPRFQKQQHIDRRDDDQRDERRDKPGPPGYKPLHQQDSKNVPFAQQPYEQRWTYNKQPQQAPPTRRNMSSLSQSSSDDNRRDNTKGYGRRRQESEEDDYRYTKEQATQSKKSIQAQITRSMSDSSDKLSDHNRSEKSTSREFLGTNVCWAEVCENDKRTIETKTRRVSESSAMSDDQPRTILQRNKPLQDQLLNKDLKKDNKESTEGEKKSVLSESPPKSDLGDEKKTQEKAADSTQVSLEQNKKSLESIPEKDQNPADKLDASKSSSKATQLKESDDNRHARDKKSSPRSNHYDRDARFGPPTRGNYSQRGGNWQGRRGGHQRGGRYDYSDSENSDDYDQEWNRNGPKNTMNRKDGGRRENSNYISGGTKEGFSPRGEPSRRGRGGVAGGPQTTGFRRSGSNGAITAPAKNRIDNYGPPSSKSPFGSNDEKSSEKRENVKEKSSDDDRTKQKQKALSDGLMNKSQKETSNVATKASSPGAPVKYDEVVKQHSTEPALAGEIKDKKSIEGSDDKTLSGQRSNSSSSFNSNQNRPKSDRATPTNASTAPAKPGTKPPQTNTMPVGKPSSAPSSHQYPPPMTKSMDPRHQMNRSQDRNDPRMDPRNASINNNNSRSAPRFTNKRDMPGSGPTNNMNRMSGNYWDKNHPDQMHGGVGDDKMPMMQMNPTSGSQGNIHSSQTNNILNSKTDPMKQQNQQQPPSMQQQQQQQNPTMLDGASLKTTLIFENTSYKSGPPAGIKRPQGPPPMGQQKPQENQINTINDMIDQQQANEQSLSSALQKISFGQNSQKDMDMNFSYPFDTQIGLLTDDRNKSSFGVVSSGSNTNVHPSQAVSKSSSLGLVGAKTGMQNSNILNTDALNMKVASCKKVWEEPSVSMEHGSVANDDVISNFVAQQHHLQPYGHNNMSSHHSGPQSYGGYGSSSGNDHNSSLEHFNKSNDNDDGSSYPSPGQQQHMSNMVHSQNQQANMNMKAAEAFGTTANVCKVKPTQQQMHQAGLSPPPQMQQNQLQQQQQQTYYSTPNYPNMSTIPSPPAVVYNTQSATGGLYNPYNMDAARAQLYGYPTGGTVGANNSMSFNAFMQTPNLASAPTHEMYQNLSQYRAAVQPFNQTPQLNNPNAAVLISSATGSNSMMSSKTNSQIGAIGSKSSQSAGPTAASGQYGQQYMNHLYHQNSYYTNSSAQPANPYYSGPTGSGAAATGNYGMFASHGTNVSNGPPPQPQQMANFGSVGQYPLGSQMLNNLVINQQYRSGPMVNAGNNGNGNSSGSNSNAPPGGYMKQQHQSQLQDPKLSSPMTDVNPSHKMYNSQNWDSSSASGNFSGNRMYGNNQQQNSAVNLQSQNQRWSQAPGPIQRPSNSNINGFNSGSQSSQPYVNYQQSFQTSHYQQRPTRNSMNLSTINNSGTSTMPQGKFQYFNPIANGMKLKTDGEKSKLQAVPTSPTKAPGDSKVD